jgi:hypothetical protein
MNLPPTAASVLALLLAAASPARAEINHLAFSNAPSPAHAAARAAFEVESGNPIEPARILVSEVDLDADGVAEILAYAETPAFCDPQGCAPAIFRRDGDTWRNILADGVVRTRAVPGTISVIDERHNGFSDLLVGSLYLIHDGTAYREDTGPVPTQLDSTAFQAACVTSPDIASEVREAAASADIEEIEEPVGAFCACLLDQFQTAGVPQTDLDLFADLLAGRKTATEAAPMSSIPDDYAATITDFRFSCAIDLRVD